MMTDRWRLGGRNRLGLAALAAGVLGWCGQDSTAAVAGAWETFYNETNTDAWAVYDYQDEGTFYYPLWSGTPVGDEYAYFTYGGDNAVSFIADKDVGSAAFTGDYQGQRIAGIACDVYIGSLAALDYVDCTIFATGPYGRQFYYSAVFGFEDFQAGGWSSLYFSFDEPWYYLSGTEWLEVDPMAFTAIEEISITFTPKVGSAGGSRVGLDNVSLEPTVVAPKTNLSLTATAPRNFRMAFTPGPGLACRVEKMRIPPATGWDTVTGQTDIKGPGEHVFLTPINGAGEFFRVATDPAYTMIFSP